jgi:hypothetical protein
MVESFAGKQRKNNNKKRLTSSLFNCLCLPVESRGSAVSAARTFEFFFEDMNNKYMIEKKEEKK